MVEFIRASIGNNVAIFGFNDDDKRALITRCVILSLLNRTEGWMDGNCSAKLMHSLRGVERRLSGSIENSVNIQKEVFSTKKELLVGKT